jgi:hypothetical protein
MLHPKPATDVDKFIGAKIRGYRIEAGLSQDLLYFG